MIIDTTINRAEKDFRKSIIAFDMDQICKRKMDREFRKDYKEEAVRDFVAKCGMTISNPRNCLAFWNDGEVIGVISPEVKILSWTLLFQYPQFLAQVKR